MSFTLRKEKKGELYLTALIFVKKLKEACDVQKNIINNKCSVFFASAYLPVLLPDLIH